MLYGWEVIAWVVNTTSTWSGIVISLFFVLIAVLLILWIGENKNTFKRALTAATFASALLFGLHALGQANIVLGSHAEILAKMHKNNVYYDVVEIVSIKHHIFAPAIITVRRQNSNREEEVLSDTGGFGFGRIAFSSKPTKENTPDPETLYATETQEESDTRRAKHSQITPMSPKNDSNTQSAVSSTSHEAIAFEPLLIEAMEPVTKQANIVN